MSLQTVLVFVLGLSVLVGGAEVLVRGATRLALRLEMPPLLVGLTVVALGTSAPEIAVSIDAARSGLGDLAVGNVVGSNIFNVLCVLGLAGLAAPLVVPSQIVRLDVPVMIGCSLLVLFLLLDGRLGALDGGVLLLFGAGYVWLLIGMVRSTPRTSEVDPAALPGGEPALAGAPGLGVDAAFIGAGLVLLVLGSNWLVDSAVVFARAADVSPAVVGLTIVAAGTSLPEVATSVVASVRGARDLAVGNVVGSNISNLLLVLGSAAILAPGGGIDVPARTLSFDIPVMLATAVACLPVVFVGHRISRWEAGIFLGYYAAYITYLILDATGHGAEYPFAAVMLGFVLPLTLLTLGVVVYRETRRVRRRS